jgi:hypothetical protein
MSLTRRINAPGSAGIPKALQIFNPVSPCCSLAARVRRLDPFTHSLPVYTENSDSGVLVA